MVSFTDTVSPAAQVKPWLCQVRADVLPNLIASARWYVRSPISSARFEFLSLASLASSVTPKRRVFGVRVKKLEIVYVCPEYVKEVDESAPVLLTGR